MNKAILNHLKSRRIAALLLAMALALLAAKLVFVAIELFVSSSQIPFDQVKWNDWSDELNPGPIGESDRQFMIRSLVTEYLPGTSRVQIEELLGTSSSHEDFRRYRPEDVRNRVLEIEQNGDSPLAEFIPKGEGYYYDEYGWDLIYEIGTYTTTAPLRFDADDEFLLIRLDENDIFESWYVVGSNYWGLIAGRSGRITFRSTR